MKIHHLLFIIAAVLTSCSNPTPTPSRGLPKEYNLAYEELFGRCYDSIPYNVIGLDLYSEGLTLDSDHRIKGSGCNLYISDIFAEGERLAPGIYRSDTTALPFTFLPGINFEGYPHGMYILNIEEDKIIDIQLLDSGLFAFRNDSLLFTLYYRNVYGTKSTYHCSFHGTLLPWLKK